MSDWPTYGPLNNGSTIASASFEAIGFKQMSDNKVSQTSAIYTAANLAIYVPFLVFQTCIAYQMYTLNGATVSGNVDVGLYDSEKNQLVHKGSTAQTGTSAIQAFDITDTLLQPGLYYMAMAADGIVGTYLAGAPLKAVAGSWGVLQQATAFPLPSPAVWTAMNNGYVPHFGVSIRTLV